LAGLDEGLRQIAGGKLIPHDEVKKSLGHGLPDLLDAIAIQDYATSLTSSRGRMVHEKKDPLIRETLVGSYRINYRLTSPRKSWP